MTAVKPQRSALIVGAGSGISASLARALHRRGFKIALVARDPAKLDTLAASTGALCIGADATKAADMERVFAEVDRNLGPLDIAIYNAGLRANGRLADINPADAERALITGAFGAFLMAQEAARRMEPRGEGAIFFTGATASVKGFSGSAAFAMGKFALRGLAQSTARELQPKGIHVAHFIIDGMVRDAARGRIEAANDTADSLMDPDAIADAYLAVLEQPRSAWTSEIELRPWAEKF